MVKLFLLTVASWALLSASAAAAPTDDVISKVNAVRAEHNLPALVANDTLGRSATLKANDMCNRNYWGHEDPNGLHGYSLIPQEGYRYKKAGENLAKGFDTIDAAVAGWVASPEHFKVMTGPEYTETGVGLVTCADYEGYRNQVIIVQHFGQPDNGNPLMSSAEDVVRQVSIWPYVINAVALLTLAVFIEVRYFRRKK